jgi:hypothetical protein
LADSVPKPYPFSAEGRKQFGELRETVDRLDTHFRALLSLKEQQIRASDRDNLRRYSEANGTQSPPTPGRVVFFRRLDHRWLAAQRVFSGQGLCQPRHQRPDYRADAGADAGRRGGE